VSNLLKEKLGKALIWFCALLTILILLIIIGYVMQNGFRVVNWDFLTQMPGTRGRSGGIWAPIVSTVYLVLLSVAIATPVGIASAIFLTEYTQENKLTRTIRFGIESLAGIPSIIYGLFGFIFFVFYLGLGWSILSGALTLAIMILPILIRATEESILIVPNSYREGSLALGATKWQTIVRVVLPNAIPGIITGIILGIGRAVGETAAVILTAGSALKLPDSVLESGRVLSLHLYLMASEGVAIEQAYGTAVVLIVFILFLNLFTNFTLKLLFRRRTAS